jgi:predicted metal-dependent hydrolase
MLTPMNHTAQLELPLPGLPAYTVRVSPRARHVRLKVSADGIEVVTPRGFDTRRIPELLVRHRDWLDKQLSRIRGRLALPTPASPDALPETIQLAAIGEQWCVDYVAVPAPCISIREDSDSRLVLRGNVHEAAACRAALKRWLTRKARRHLEPWLRDLSQQSGMPFQRMTVRGQKTRWGSCSRHKTISINYKLLFVPPHLVQHVFLHELCHTRVMNHSPEYWRLLAALEPDHKDRRRELHDTGRRIPAWVNG